jgi:hypothetical protein
MNFTKLTRKAIITIMLCCMCAVTSGRRCHFAKIPHCSWWMNERVWRTDGMILTGKSRSTRGKITCHNTTLPTRSSTRTKWQVQSQASLCGLYCGQSEVLGQIFLRVLPFSPITIIPSMLEPHSSVFSYHYHSINAPASFFCQRHYVILAIDKVVK